MFYSLHGRQFVNNMTFNVYYGTGDNPELSNLAPRKFTYKGIEYVSVEHAYQTLKTGKFDSETYEKYFNSPYKKIRGNSGKLSQRLTELLMYDLIEESLNQNPDIMKMLMDSGDMEITHYPEKSVWGEIFPRILMNIRESNKKDSFKIYD